MDVHKIEVVLADVAAVCGSCVTFDASVLNLMATEYIKERYVMRSVWRWKYLHHQQYCPLDNNVTYCPALLLPPS